MQKLFLLILFSPIAAHGQLHVAKIFTDNMILQRDMPVHIWGMGNPGETISISFSQNKKMTRVKADSSWRVVFGKQKAGAVPTTIKITSAAEKVVLRNILFGDLWICIGQSNMEWPMAKEKHFKEEILQADQPLIRLYNPAYAGKNIFGTPFTDSIVQQLNINDFYQGKWQICDSNTVKTMSAVAYYFGKTIAHEIRVPVGLIHLAIGGAPLESFISSNALKKDLQFSSKTKGNWLMNDALPVWIRERGEQNVGNNKHVLTDETGPAHGYEPGFAFDAGINPILSLPVKGILCYQGESNAQENERVNEYGKLLALMVNDYREKWRQSSLPFYFVQLSSIDTTNYKGQLWPQFRDEQRKAMDLIKYSGMAVCSDIGSRHDVHPNDKRTVGQRLARWALNKTYSKNIIPSGPLPVSATFKNHGVIVTFQFAGTGLRTVDNNQLAGWSLDGKTDAIASLQTNTTVMVVAGEKPEYIYYGWKPFTEANLVNSEQLPASTFKIKVQ